MSVLVLLMAMMMMKSEAASARITTVSSHSDESVLLPPEGRVRTALRWDVRWDVRWTHHHLVLSLKSNATTCHHGRCEMLSDGSLRFNRVRPQDSGNYSLEVFYENGTRLMRRDFLLHVEAAAGDSSSVALPVSISCLLLFLLLSSIVIFILWRKRMNYTNTSGPTEENVYIRMLSRRGNMGADDAEKEQEKVEDPVYVLCHPAVAMDTPITRQMVEDDIYV